MTEEVKDPNEVQSINIDGTPHDIDSLTELAKFYVSQLQDLQQKLGRLKFEVTQVEVANNGFMQMLRDEIANPKPPPTAEPPVEVVQQ